MKCLLCKFNSNEISEVRNHYLNFRNVDKTNVFFKRLFKGQNNVFYGRRCVRCNDFLPTTKFKWYHDFFKHYNDGKNIIDEKPVIVSTIGKIKKFEIIKIIRIITIFIILKVLLIKFYLKLKTKFKDLKSIFSFSVVFHLKIFNLLLTTRMNRWKIQDIGQLIQFKLSLLTIMFFFNIRESILKRLINIGLTGSVWHFNRFLYINVKIIKVTDQLIRLDVSIFIMWGHWWKW